jgi:hypothetical protein
VNLKQIQPQRPGRFSNALQRRAPIGRWVNKNKIKRHCGYLFEHGEVNNYTLDGVTNSVDGEEGNRLGISP